MKTRPLYFNDLVQIVCLVSIALLAVCLSGCQSLLSDGSTKVSIDTPAGLKVRYQSPKDQHVEYDPATGKIVVDSRTSAELAAQAALVASQERQATTDLLKTVIARIPLDPTQVLNPVNK